MVDFCTIHCIVLYKIIISQYILMPQEVLKRPKSMINFV